MLLAGLAALVVTLSVATTGLTAMVVPVAGPTGLAVVAAGGVAGGVARGVSGAVGLAVGRLMEGDLEPGELVRRRDRRERIRDDRRRNRGDWRR
ncbi:hypothetical protein STENM327S_09236 [Streptomyces tendae]